MKGEPKILELLNEVLTAELTTINQYFLHARMCRHWGFEKVAERMYKASICDMKQATKIIDRILLLEGVPNLQRLGKLNIGENVAEQLSSDMAFELEAASRLRKGIKLCADLNDHGTRDLLESILSDEEEYIDWLETQTSMIKDLGIENYLAEQIS